MLFLNELEDFPLFAQGDGRPVCFLNRFGGDLFGCHETRFALRCRFEWLGRDVWVVDNLLVTLLLLLVQMVQRALLSEYYREALHFVGLFHRVDAHAKLLVGLAQDMHFVFVKIEPICDTLELSLGRLFLQQSFAHLCFNGLDLGLLHLDLLLDWLFSFLQFRHQRWE